MAGHNIASQEIQPEIYVKKSRLEGDPSESPEQQYVLENR